MIERDTQQQNMLIELEFNKAANTWMASKLSESAAVWYSPCAELQDCLWLMVGDAPH